MEYVPPLPEYQPTLPNLIRDAVSHFADSEYMVFGSTRHTYSSAECASAVLARGLLSIGICKGSRVAILLPDTPDWVMAWWAAGRIGALVIPLSTMYQPRELAWALKEADIDTLLMVDSFLGVDYVDRVERAIPMLSSQNGLQLFVRSHPYLRRIVVWGECERPWAIRGPDALASLAESNLAIDDDFLREIESQVTPSDLLIGICTSGSTSLPKIVLHTHGSMIRATHAVQETFLGMIKPADRCYSGMPLFWVGGMNVNLMPATYAGACIVFAPSPKPHDILEVIVRERVTRVAMWPTQYKPLLNLAVVRGVHLSNVTMVNRPDDRVDPPAPADRRIASLLGMTETFGPHGFGNWDEDLGERNGGSYGRQVQGVDRRIVDPDTHVELPAGQPGELYVRGFSLMDGYYKRERSQVFVEDGWFATGDICSINVDGCLFFLGRRGDMIKTLGANVSPQEVEAFMLTYPGVAEAIVVGIPDESSGERVVAAVVAQKGKDVDAAQLRQHMLQVMSSYKVPKVIVMMSHDEVPRTAASKVQRNSLKAILENQLTAEVRHGL